MHSPVSLSEFIKVTLPILLDRVDGSKILEVLDSIVRTDRWNSLDRFQETTRTLIQRYEAAGARTELYTIPTGGDVGTGRWIVREAHDVLRATVNIVSPIQQPLLDMTQNPWHVIQWSTGTPAEGITNELIVIDDLGSLDQMPAGALAGKMVLTRMSPRGYLKALTAKGAMGVITDISIHERPDATAWVKFGWGSIPITEGSARLVGLVLSETEGARLRALLLQHRSLTLHTIVEVRQYEGTHDLVSGIVVGRDDPQDEIWVLAHSSEPGAVDNASGVAVCVEIARIIEELIAEGRIARPRRSIRFLNGYECYSFFHYMEHAARLQPPLAGVNLDTLGARPEICDGRLSWRATIPMSAGFVDRVGEAMLRATLDLADSGYTLHPGGFVATSDTLVGDPKYGFPCPWLTTHYLDEGVYREYHSSADIAALLSPVGLATCAAAIAGYVCYLADMGSAEVVEWASAETEHALTQISYRAATPKPVYDETHPVYIRTVHQTTMTRLRRWLWGGDRGAILAHLADCEQRVVEASGPSARILSDSIDVEISHEMQRVPQRTAFLSPDLENTPIPIAERLSESQLPEWTLFWADGHRTLMDIALLTSCELKIPVKFNQINEYFNALADLGYVKLRHPDEMITRQRLLLDLQAIGLERGMDVIVHSSLSQIGYVAGGAEVVVAVLLDILGPNGTLLAPSFNHRTAQVFNPMSTPTTSGAIADALWRRPDAVRSVHATHSVAAVGARAGDYCRPDHVFAGIWAPDSPIGRLVRHGGYILLLGVTHDSTTAYHVAEVSLSVGCISSFANTDYIVNANGQVHAVPGLAYRVDACPVPPTLIHASLQAQGLERSGKIAGATATFVKAINVWQTRREHLKDCCPTCRITPNIR